MDMEFGWKFEGAPELTARDPADDRDGISAPRACQPHAFHSSIFHININFSRINLGPLGPRVV